MGPGGFRRLQNGRDPASPGWVGSIPARSRHRFSPPAAYGLVFLYLTLPVFRSLGIYTNRRLRHAALVAAMLGVFPAASAHAQAADSARAGVRARPDTARPKRPAAVRDSLAPPISPRRAFLYSLALPGLGQSRLQRPTAGAVYFGFELLSVAMLGKSSYDLSIAKRRVKENIIRSYRVDASGVPQFDSAGRAIAKDTVPNRYDSPAAAGSDQQSQLRSRLKARRLHYEDWIATMAFIHLFAGADAYVSAHLWDLPRQVEFRRLPSGAAAIGAHLTFR